MEESDPPSLREVKSATLQINGIMSRLQAGKMNIENAVQLCFEMTDKIDFDASNISKDVKATNTALRLEMRNIRHKNIKLMQAKYQLKSQLKKAQQKMKDFEDMNVSDVEMMSFSQSLEHSMATQEKGKETKAKNEYDPNAQCSQEKEPKAEVGNDENTQSNETKDDENNPDAYDGNDKLTKKMQLKLKLKINLVILKLKLKINLMIILWQKTNKWAQMILKVICFLKMGLTCLLKVVTWKLQRMMKIIVNVMMALNVIPFLKKQNQNKNVEQWFWWKVYLWL